MSNLLPDAAGGNGKPPSVPQSKPRCINLRELFGARFVISHEESYLAEKPEFRQEEEVWLQIIPCVRGHLMPFDKSHFAACTDCRGSVIPRLMAVPTARMWQDGDDGANIVFHVDRFEEVALIMRPRRRRVGKPLSPEAREKLVRAGEAYRFSARRTGPNARPDGLERDGGPLVDTLDVDGAQAGPERARQPGDAPAGGDSC